MAVKLRLQRKGRRKAPFYHIVVADARAPRDGRYIEKIGSYNPLTVPATIELNRERAFYWFNTGAQPTDTVHAILRFKGILYQKHLAEGVKKGAFTAEQAEAKLQAWIEQKDVRIAQRREDTAEKKRQYVAAVDGTMKVRAKAIVKEEVAPVAEEAAPVAEEVTAVAAEVAAPVAEAVAPAAEEVVVAAEEAAPAAEEVVAAAEEVAPAAEEVVAAAEEVAPAAEEVVAVAEEVAPAAEEVVAVAEEAAPAAEEEKTEEA